jgi:manganese transport protein
MFGYKLLWVIVASNLMAMLIQTLSAKLGIATGYNLAEHCRIRFPRPIVYSMWVLMEVVAMATDLAEFLGAALGFNLLLGIPLWMGGILTAISTFLILSLERYGFRPLEAVITTMVGIIAGCYLIETILDRPDWGQVAFNAVVPRFSGPESVLLATGILGATVMPHVIFCTLPNPGTNHSKGSYTIAQIIPFSSCRRHNCHGYSRNGECRNAHYGSSDLLQARFDYCRYH